MPGIGLIVRVVGLGSKDPEFKFHSAVELIPGEVDSTCHPSEVGKNECQNAGTLWRSGDPSRIVPNSQGDCLGSTNALHKIWSQWMDGWNEPWTGCHSVTGWVCAAARHVTTGRIPRTCG